MCSSFQPISQDWQFNHVLQVCRKGAVFKFRFRIMEAITTAIRNNLGKLKRLRFFQVPQLPIALLLAASFLFLFASASHAQSVSWTYNGLGNAPTAGSFSINTGTTPYTYTASGSGSGFNGTTEQMGFSKLPLSAISKSRRGLIL